jgi:hypothetical protein
MNNGPAAHNASLPGRSYRGPDQLIAAKLLIHSDLNPAASRNLIPADHHDTPNRLLEQNDIVIRTGTMIGETPASF